MHTRKMKLIFAGIVISFLLFAAIVGAVFTIFTASNKDITPAEIVPDLDTEPFEPDTEPITTTSTSRGLAGGELVWATRLSSDPDEAMLSTPAICDLNPPAGGAGKKQLEVVVACTDDHIYAVNQDGKERWTYSDLILDDAETVTNNVWPTLDFDPPYFFSSITPVDIGGGKAPELLLGEQDGVVCLSPDGSTYWKDKGQVDGYYFSSVAVTDLEGDFMGKDADGNFIGYRDDLEIILGSDDDADAQGYLECWQANGQEVFKYQVQLDFEHSFIAASIVTTELDGYFQGEEKPLEWAHENAPDKLRTDILTSTHAYSNRIWQWEGPEWDDYHEAKSYGSHFDTHQNYATPVVGNFTGGPDLEIIVGYGSGHNWEQSDGGLVMVNKEAIEISDRFTVDSVPAAFYSSPAVCDAQNLDPDKLDDDEVIDYEVFVGCDGGTFYCVSASDLTEIWSYEIGERVISSPAICNINSDDTLEVIVGANDGKVYCFEADPQELDAEGEAHPKDDGMEDGGGETGIYDILWIYDTKDDGGAHADLGIGTSSPVVADINYDGQLEVLIGDTGGTLYCISAGGSCVPGQVDWPMFHYDLNKTGFYKPGTSYGVKVDPQITTDEYGNPHKEDLTKSVKPGDFETYNVTVTNIGSSASFSEEDTFWLRLNQYVYKGGEIQEEHEWPAPWISGEDLEWSGGGEGKGQPYVRLMSFDKANLTLTVPAPWSGDLSEFTQVELEANSSKDVFARDSVMTTTNLEIFLDFDVEVLKEPVSDKESDLYGQKVIKINPSDKTGVEVNLNNKGNLNDTYDLRIDGVLYGWEAYFTKSDSSIYNNALQLDAEIMAEQFPMVYSGSDGKVTFNIVAPADAQENEIITLKVVATSQYSQSTNLIDNISKYDYLIIEVNPVPDLELDCKDPRQYVTAGDNVTFKVDVINRGNSEITVRLEHSQLESGWDLFFTNDFGIPFAGDVDIQVMNDGVSVVNVAVRAPTTAAAGSRQNIIIRGTTITESELALQSTDTCALTAIVRQFFDINVSVTPPSISVDPGYTIRYNITVDNSGNGNDFIIITPTLLEVNWDSTFYIGSDERVTSDLNYNESVTFQMQITIPNDQLAGKYKTGVNVSGIGDREIMYFDTVVNQIYDLSIFGVVHSQETSDKQLTSLIKPEPGVSPGSILNYVFEVTNGGNAPDEVKMELQSIGEDWLDWEGVFLGLTNTEAYMTDVENLDFSSTIDMSIHTAPVGYLNSNPDTTLHEITMKLGVGQKVWLKVQLFVPREIESDRERKFNLHSESTDPKGVTNDEDINDNDVSMMLKILFPDLVLPSNIRHPSTINNGDIVTISVEVKNDGDIEARDVLVTFYVDGKEVKTQTINILPKDSTRLIPFTWQSSEGGHDLKIKVDPEDAIVEKYEDNNEKTKEVNVESGSFIEILSNRAVCSILPLIIVAIILAVIIVIIKKRGSFLGLKPGGGGEVE